MLACPASGGGLRRTGGTLATLDELGEFEVIRRLRELRTAGAAAPEGVRVDSGDDAAVLRPADGFDVVATTDAFVEGIHYDRTHLARERLGVRLARANASDLAAMAARPRWALFSAGIRRDHDVDDLVAVQRGLMDALAVDGAAVVGGNLCGVEGAEWFSLTLMGEVPRDRAWTRAGARAGDLIAVTGHPGRAGAGSRLALTEGHAPDDAAALTDAWLSPPSRVAFALALEPLGAVHAAIDLSDGIAGDLAHVCAASRLGARLDAASWPADPELEHVAMRLDTFELDLRLGASDDYELLLALDPSRRGDVETIARAQGVPVRIVGVFTSGRIGVEWAAFDGTTREITTRGWDQFRSGTPGR